MSREERIGENEVFCRDLNRSKDDWLRGGVLAAGFRCECWRLDCGVRIQLSRREWQEVRSQPDESTELVVEWADLVWEPLEE